jgi:hypothetical protein
MAAAMGTEVDPDETDDVDEGLDAIDLTLADTFPASDPPSWNLGRYRTDSPGEPSSEEKPSSRG